MHSLHNRKPIKIPTQSHRVRVLRHVVVSEQILNEKYSEKYLWILCEKYKVQMVFKCRFSMRSINGLWEVQSTNGCREPRKAAPSPAPTTQQRRRAYPVQKTIHRSRYYKTHTIQNILFKTANHSSQIKTQNTKWMSIYLQIGFACQTILLLIFSMASL